MHAIPFQFQPLCSSWVALHPSPKGVVQFIGGAFFGRLPTAYYRLFLQKIFENGYTIVALPFRSTLNHWAIALDLLEEHYRLRHALVEMAFAASQCSVGGTNWNYQIYLKPENYAWVGHSLGCKYIALLEILTGQASSVMGYFKSLDLSPLELRLIQLKVTELEHLVHQLSTQIKRLTQENIQFETIGIFNEPSILLAPVITDLTTAIPLKTLQALMISLGINVLPTVEQTHQLIQHSQCFNLTAVIQFERDRYAKPTCDRLCEERSLITQIRPGRHLAPMLHDYSKSHLAVLSSLEQLKSRLDAPETMPSLVLNS